VTETQQTTAEDRLAAVEARLDGIEVVLHAAFGDPQPSEPSGALEAAHLLFVERIRARRTT
jgi:hypothetical protein